MDAQDSLQHSPTEPDGDYVRAGAVLLERYRLDRLLGEGAMGRVYAAEHVVMKRRVAVKVLHRHLTSVPEVVARFEREAMAASSIQHPNVAAASDFGKLPDGQVFLVLEFVEGRSLRDVLAHSGPMPMLRVLHIARQIAAALLAAHALGIVHRDLKPENVSLVAKGSDPDFVKVLDFGVAKVPPAMSGDRPTRNPGELVTRSGMVFGTPEYMAPEQALGREVDGRADLFALGVMMFEMLAGVRPWGGGDEVGLLGEQLSGPVPRVSERAPGIVLEPQLEALIVRLLDKDVEARPEGAQQVVEVLDRFLGIYRTSLPPPAAVGEGLAPVVVPAPSGEAPTLSPEEVLKASSSGRQQWPALLAAPSPGPLASVRRRLPGGLQRKLAPISDRLLLGGGSAMLLVGVGLGFALSSPRPAAQQAVVPTAASSANASLRVAPADKISDAKRNGVVALEALSQQYPEDSGLLLELAKEQRLERRPLQAVETLSRLLKLEPARSADAEVGNLLWQAAQSPEAEDASFALLEQSLGERGVDILFDLATAAGVGGAARSRASARLVEPAIIERASSALRPLLRLRVARTCEALRELLPAVEKDSDRRAVPFLRQLESKPCVASDPHLASALAAADQRLH